MAIGGLSRRAEEKRAALRVGRAIDVLASALGRAVKGADRPIGYALTTEEARLRRISDQRILELVFERRARQLKDPNRAGATVVPSRGVFAGYFERSAIIDILWFPTAREPTFDRFVANISRLAEDLALGLAQAEVLVTIHEGGFPPQVIAASPRGLPGPDTAEFKTWLRRSQKGKEG